MSSPGLTSSAQLRYILQWFGEFSELQREDFLPILAAASQDKQNQLASILESLTCEDKPVSLFQCRIKLFNEWYPTWAEEEQRRLLKGVTEIDDEFGKKLQEILTNGPKLNGDINGTNGVHTPEAPVQETLAEPSIEQEETAVSHNEEETVVDEKVEEVLPENIVTVEIAAAS